MGVEVNVVIVLVLFGYDIVMVSVVFDGVFGDVVVWMLCGYGVDICDI